MKQNIMKATEKIKLMIDLEFGFKQLDLEELHMIKDTLNKEIDNKFKLFHRGERLHKAVLKRELKKRLAKFADDDIEKGFFKS
tara:strand:- start:54 stop:302 length:249 start_codon:yes stop_codon:yes gene_type:complete